MHEVFAHTADLGLHIAAATLDELYAEAGVGLFEIIAGDVQRVQPSGYGRNVPMAAKAMMDRGASSVASPKALCRRMAAFWKTSSVSSHRRTRG